MNWAHTLIIALLKQRPMSTSELAQELSVPPHRVATWMRELEQAGRVFRYQGDSPGRIGWSSRRRNPAKPKQPIPDAAVRHFFAGKNHWSDGQYCYDAWAHTSPTGRYEGHDTFFVRKYTVRWDMATDNEKNRHASFWLLMVRPDRYWVKTDDGESWRNPTSNPSRRRSQRLPLSQSGAEAMYERFHESKPRRKRRVSVASPPGNGVALGKVVSIVYQPPGYSGKGSHLYEHKFGDTGDRMLRQKPILVVSPDGKQLFIIKDDSRFVVNERGIVG